MTDRPTAPKLISFEQWLRERGLMTPERERQFRARKRWFPLAK